MKDHPGFFLVAIVAICAVSGSGASHAYKVERQCEEVTTKNGVMEKCKTVMVQEAAPDKKDGKKDDKKDAKKDEKKGAKPAAKN
jgi:hypothetical protein